ncbi:MAG: hypothetical protein EAX89_05760 [Candidatus Lokiarchaeota archaeon]|nr:hypothetical protein [Candidatus Lokiarchaeota archaeon]
MSDDQEPQDEEIENDNESTEIEEDDLKSYLSEMKSLETDFSDLDDLDFEEIKEMQEAILKVKEMESLGIEPQLPKDIEDGEKVDSLTQQTEAEEYLAQREAMITDFSDLEELDFDELREMKEAIETVKQEEIQSSSGEISENFASSGISSELQDRIKQELLERKEEKEKKIITPEKFLEYAKGRRDKIWYHALYYLVFNAEDNEASKELLYEMLKEVTSKSPIDPIQEHQFYFGLGYILRLNLNEKQIVRFLRGGKFKINIGLKGLKEMLEEIGAPISTRPVLEEEEKREMFIDFLKDDFTDI